MMKKLEMAITVLAVGILIISLIPILWIGLYNHSCADDYSYGLLPYHAWKETGSIIEVFKAVITQVMDSYQSWQGTFSGVLAMTMQPAVFGENAYVFSTFILLITYILANIFLMKIILRDYIKTNRCKYWIFTSVLLFLSIQFLPSPVQGFYWYNGSILYTFFYSLMLVLIACILKLWKEENKKRIIYACCILLLAFILGGSNYTTALLSNILLFGLAGYSIIMKKKGKKIITFAFILCFIGLMISATAPGNAVRQDAIEQTTTRPGTIMSILYSFSEGMEYLLSWQNIVQSILWVSLLPLFYCIAKNMDYKFKKPLLVLLLSICVFCAQFTPQIYAQGFTKLPGRMENIIYFSSLWLIGINLFYFIGWLSKRKNQNIAYLSIIPITIILIMGAWFGNRNYKMTSIEAGKSLISGEAQQYDKEIDERMEIYLNDEIKNAEIPELTVKPYIIFFTDIQPDPSNWLNASVREYFQKESVILIERENVDETKGND